MISFFPGNVPHTSTLLSWKWAWDLIVDATIVLKDGFKKRKISMITVREPNMIEVIKYAFLYLGAVGC
jgi:hypothetical protein